MKKFLLFAIALLAISLVSCGGCDDTSYCEAFEVGEVYKNSGELYKRSGRIYMADRDPNTNRPTELRIKVGTVYYGQLELFLRNDLSYVFLTELDSETSPGMYAEPSDITALLYENPLVLIDEGLEGYIGDLEYKMTDESKHHKIFYWYFSKDAKINHSYYNSETETFECGYSIDAKKGWNKVYFYENIADGKTCYTTDLSEAPDGLKWIHSEPAKQ